LKDKMSIETWNREEKPIYVCM